MQKPDYTEADLSSLESTNRAFWSKLDEESDLGAVLSSGAYFENKLETCLRRYFAPVSAADNLLGPRGALGPFGARLDCARSLRIVNEGHYQSLKRVGRIRNKFAHNLEASFDDQSIADQVEDLFTTCFAEEHLAELDGSKVTMTAREKFKWTCFSVAMELSHREIDVWMHVLEYEDLIPDHLDANIAELEVE